MADDPIAPPRVSIFSGDLNGWHAHNNCETEVVDDALRLKAGDGLLWHDLQLRNFVFETDWRPLKEKDYDAGIYFRCDLPPEGKPFPAKYQVNLKQGDEANLIGFKDGRSTGHFKPGEWNHLKLTVNGTKAEMEINGQPAWKVDGLEDRRGYFGLQVEVPLGGEHEFKNMFVTELGYRPLFNGVDLAGWEGAGEEAAKCWKVADGLLTCTGEKGPWLRTTEEFDDFNVRLEYKLKAGGNSGVYIRVPANGNHHGDDAGIEMQLLDDGAARYKNLKDYQYTGSLYAIVAADPRVSRGPEVWNSIEINCRGSDYFVIHNGVQVVKAGEADNAELGKRRKKGFLGLQNHSEEVWFRNVRVGPAVE
jgi:hypothetical protein